MGDGEVWGGGAGELVGTGPGIAGPRSGGHQERLCRETHSREGMADQPHMCQGRLQAESRGKSGHTDHPHSAAHGGGCLTATSGWSC